MTSLEVRMKVVSGYQLPRPLLKLNTAQLAEASGNDPVFPLCPLHLYVIMQQCWTFIPLYRPTFRSLHRLLSLMDFGKSGHSGSVDVLEGAEDYAHPFCMLFYKRPTSFHFYFMNHVYGISKIYQFIKEPV